MLNVDGVVGGHYRTGMSGHDLNRMYGRKDELCPEVNLVADLSKQYKLIGVLDLHGHSQKQNAFIYGGGTVDYQPHDFQEEYLNKSREYYECRLFAQSLHQNQQQVTPQNMQSFNKRNCLFGLAANKHHSCRGYFYNTRHVLHSYTLEISNQGYQL